MKRLSLLVAALILLLPASTFSQVYKSGRLLTKTGATTQQYETGSHDQFTNGLHAFWFNLNVTAIDQGTVTLYIVGYNPTTAAWEGWFAGGAVSSVTSNQLCVAPITSFSGAGAVCDVKITSDMPAKWKVSVVHAGSSTASYTVDYWAY